MTRKQKEEPKKKHYSSKLPWPQRFQLWITPLENERNQLFTSKIHQLFIRKGICTKPPFLESHPPPWRDQPTWRRRHWNLPAFWLFRDLRFRKVSERSNFHQYAGRASLYLEKSDVSDCLWYTSLKKNEVGAWNHANKHHGGCCSGFPLEKTRVLLAGHERYLESCWEDFDKYLQHGLTNQGYRIPLK